MIEVIGVRFKKACKIYYFDPLDIGLEAGDGVIVETVKGIEYGDVVIGRREVSDEEVIKPLKPIIRKATEKDKERLEENKQKEQKAFAVCKEKIEKHNLDMKLINVEYTFDASKIIFSFTAEGRVDFRELVKDLAAVFKTRIELRQIGVRDETKLIGGLGPCGRPACCSVFLGDFQPVSIKMAKEQNLSLSPTKISGLCGRLMCCLNYEQAYYEELRNVLPRNGAEVRTPDGKGTVMDSNAVKQLVKVRVEIGEDESDIREYHINDIKILRKGGKKPRSEEEAATGEEQDVSPAEEAAEAEQPKEKRAQKENREGQNRDNRGRQDNRSRKGDSNKQCEHKEAQEPREPKPQTPKEGEANKEHREGQQPRNRNNHNRNHRGNRNRPRKDNAGAPQGEGNKNA